MPNFKESRRRRRIPPQRDPSCRPSKRSEAMLMILVAIRADSAMVHRQDTSRLSFTKSSRTKKCRRHCHHADTSPIFIKSKTSPRLSSRDTAIAQTLVMSLSWRYYCLLAKTLRSTSGERFKECFNVQHAATFTKGYCHCANTLSCHRHEDAAIAQALRSTSASYQCFNVGDTASLQLICECLMSEAAWHWLDARGARECEVS